MSGALGGLVQVDPHDAGDTVQVDVVGEKAGFMPVGH
jgi:hypothetical protein